MAARVEPGAASAAHAMRPRPKARRRHIKFTREGRVFVLVTLGVGFAALNTGNNLMYLTMAFMLSLIVLSGILSELAIKGLRVRRSLPERAFVGSPALVELRVENEKRRLPSYSLEVEDRAEWEEQGRRCYLLKVEPGRQRSVTYRRVPTRRGWLALERVRIGTRYPFSLFDKWRFQTQPDRLLVYPRLEPWEVHALAGESEGDRDGRAAGRGAETRGLREFRDRDEMRRIHWRRSATVGRPVVREMEDEAAELVSLVVDNAGPVGDEHFQKGLEQVVSRAAHAVQALLARGASVEIVARGERSVLLEAGSRPEPLWRFLALLEPRDEASAPALEASRPGARRLPVPGGEGEPG